MTAGSLTKAQFIAHANRYCRHSWGLILQRFAAYRDSLSSNVSEEKVFTGASWRLVLPAIEFQFDQMHQILGAPAGDEHQVEKMLGTMQLAIESGEKQRPASPRQLSALFADYNQLADRYGVSDCLVREAYFGR